MPDKISILKESGETLSSNVVSVFMIPDTQKKYIITTENAVDPHGLTVLHVSEIVDGALAKIATDDEWSSIKTIMRAIISGSVGSYQYLQTIDNIKANAQYSRDISVSASAAKQMVDNYAAGEKSNAVASVPAAAPVPELSQAPGAAAPNASIFPTNGAVPVANDDELIPGIAEVGTGMPPVGAAPDPLAVNPVLPGVPPVTPGVVPQMDAINPAVVGTPGVIAPTDTLAPAAPVDPMVVPQTPAIDPLQGAVPATPVVPEPIVPVAAQPVTPDVPLNGLSNDVQVIPGMDVNAGLVPPVAQVPVSPTMPGSVNPASVPMDVAAMMQPMTGDAPAASEVVQTPETPAPSDIQIAPPAQAIPTAQIVQEAQPAQNEVKFDTNVIPSFAPNASLDEVVLAAQEMFMEGVKNLVQTIQEKVYRELYAKENELKTKEEVLNQRELMINEQMKVMMSNFAAIGGAPLMGMSPTKVEATNDAK